MLAPNPLKRGIQRLAPLATPRVKRWASHHYRLSGRSSENHCELTCGHHLRSQFYEGNIVKILFAMAATLALSACASLHTAPQSGPVATVTFVATNSQDALNVFAYYRDNTECLDPQKMGGFGQPFFPMLRALGGGRGRLTTQVVADRLAVVQMRLKRPAVWLEMNCTVTVEFLPLPGEQYEVLFDTDRKQCRATVDRVTTGERVKEETARPSAKQCSTVLEF